MKYKELLANIVAESSLYFIFTPGSFCIQLHSRIQQFLVNIFHWMYLGDYFKLIHLLEDLFLGM